MRIAFVHSFYRSERPSGENEIVLAQAEALQRAGHGVRIVARRTDDHSGPFSPIVSAITVATGRGPNPMDELRAFGPDVVHVHNLFPNFGEHWVTRWDGPLVATLHNFRHFCANALLWRDGNDCTLCPDGNPLAALRYRCYRDSALATLPLAVKNLAGVKTPLLARADRVVALSRRSADTFEGYGLDPARLRVVPHGVPSLGECRPQPQHQRWIALGRLDEAKGFAHLLRQWPHGIGLDIAGDGPVRGELEAFSHPDVTLLGSQSREWVASHLSSYTGLVFPSMNRENCPLVILEAFSCGLPVLARAGSAGADLVAEVSPEWTYEDADSLQAAMTRVAQSGQRGRDLAHGAYQARYREQTWVERMLSIYDEL